MRCKTNFHQCLALVVFLLFLVTNDRKKKTGSCERAHRHMELWLSDLKLLFGLTGEGGLRHTGIYKDVLDTVFQEKLQQTSHHYGGRCLQSLVHFQLSVRGRISTSHHYWRGGDYNTTCCLRQIQMYYLAIGMIWFLTLRVNVRLSSFYESWWRPWAVSGVRRSLLITSSSWVQETAWRPGSW